MTVFGMEFLFAMCAILMSVESRAIQSGSSDKDSSTLPVELVEGFAIPPIPSAYYDRTIIAGAKIPYPEDAKLQEAAKADHVQLPGLPFLPLGRVQSNQHYPSNFSGWAINKKGAKIMGVNEKKAGSLSPISKLVRGVYWMDSVLPISPKRRQHLIDSDKWVHDVKTTRKVIRMEKSTQCGNNYLAILDDQSKACIKQRHNYDQVQGEIFAYFLAELLQMKHHLPPTVLSRAVHNKLFEPVIQQLHDSLSFDPTKPFIITKFVEKLQPVYLPEVLHALVLNSSENGVLISPRSMKLGQMKIDEMRQLGDLIVFDYLIGHLDRMSAMNLNWNPVALKEPIHNLYQTNGSLLFIDNESGLFHGYRLLPKYDKNLQKFVTSNCLFNKPTVTAVKRLVDNRNAGTLLGKMLRSDYPQLVTLLPGIGPKTSQILQKRLRFVYRHMKFCEENEFLP